MSLQEVTDDYLKEQTMLQAWKERMDETREVTGTPPESQMSLEYKNGWKDYLDFVLAISRRMIAMCNAAKVSGDTQPLKQVLQKEMQGYTALAAEAEKMELIELKGMLEHEAESRGKIVAVL